ncbi:MAG TPA: ABC transporter ATP-binding protein [Candidatus Limnocylindria bacterium]|nr:ABC transporter ATP-binding protein [Candidatus Limnocylindria bacterium]
MKPAQVTLENIGKCYGQQWVVRDVNLQIQAGDFFTFLGPSGCGKTTLLRMIAGFAIPDRGSIHLDDQEISRVPPWQRDIGMVFQNYALWPHMTVFENVAFGLRERKVPRGEILTRVNQALATVDLKGRESHRPSQLSGGQQQRVALARILVIQPRVVLLDEPLSNLDAKLRIEMRLELLKLQRDLGLTTIYVTHDQGEALAMSTKIAVINHGQVVQVGPPRAIYEQPIDNFVAAFVGQANLLPGAIRSRSDHTYAVDIGDGNVVLAHAIGLTFQAGDAVSLSLRPEAVELSPCEAEKVSLNALQGKIIAAAYQGAVVEYEVSAVGTTLKVRVANATGQTLYQRGDAVCLSFAPEAVTCLAGFSNK